jgi:UDP-N-acetylmuramyl pentapeptide phosphotransferase/UDP-N-acetylglucosamine-1-phosphate transferase
MPQNIPLWVQYAGAALVALAISMYAVKKIIFITRTRQLFDVPDNVRKIHGAQIPSLGGIGIFTGYVITSAFFMPPEWYYVIAASVILFFTGIYDDIMNMRPSRKLAAQLLASAIAVVFAGGRLEFLPIWGTIPDSIITILLGAFFINVFNFIDGIDGLACMLAVFYLGALSALFIAQGNAPLACICFSLAGATLGLLYYNWSPARIYMGDTGSMILGFTIFILSVWGINAGWGNVAAGLSITDVTWLVLSLVSVPLFDAFRVFVMRAMSGVSPLRADRRHLHYYLVDAGMPHSRAVLVIAGTNLVVLILAFFLLHTHFLILLANLLLLPGLVSYWAAARLRKL